MTGRWYNHMALFDFSTVNTFIATNLFNTEKWDGQNDPDKQKVINNAELVLYRELPHHFNTSKPIPLDILAEQCLHILEFDDSVKRAELGVSYFFTSGLYVSFDKDYGDRTIARTILHRYPRRKSGRTVVSKQDTYRNYSVRTKEWL
jgi:hypothetical protein